MEKDSSRLSSLDGLRGLAVLLVFLNHINPKYLITSFPILDKIGLFSSGVTGVSFFFILSGFLMAYLYPFPKNKLDFLQKRYTRIFPLFLTMCASMLIFALNPIMPWYLQIGAILFLASTAHLVWVYGIKRIRVPIFSRVLFLSFLALQFIVGGFYVLRIMRQPPIVLQSYPEIIKTAILGLVNATLTFPLGNYIPMLDGVYWSLAAEILFYCLYPFFITPLVLLLVPQKKIVKIIFLLSLFPLLGGIDILSHYIFNLSTLQFTLFYYFAFGILLGHLYRKTPQVFNVFSKIFKGPFKYLPVMLLIAALVGEHFLNAIFPSSYGPWVRLLSVFPFSLLIAIALNKTTTIYKFLSTKVLVFVGTISYSLYLSHAAVIHMAETFHQSGSLAEDIYTIFITLAISIVISSILYYLLEKPYFKKAKIDIAKNTSLPSAKLKWSKTVLGLTTGIYLLAIFLSFQSQFNLFSLVTPLPSSVFLNNSSAKISLQNNPQISARFTSTENNLGIISLTLTHINPTHQIENSPTLVFTLSQEGVTKPIATLPYVLDEFRGVDFPFGFPTITDSKGKTYIASFSLVPPSQNNYAVLDSETIKAVYQIDKKTLLKNPSTALSLGENKIQSVFSNPLSKITLFLLLPFLLTGLYLMFNPAKLTNKDFEFLQK